MPTIAELWGTIRAHSQGVEVDARELDAHAQALLTQRPQAHVYITHALERPGRVLQDMLWAAQGYCDGLEDHDRRALGGELVGALRAHPEFAVDAGTPDGCGHSLSAHAVAVLDAIEAWATTPGAGHGDVSRVYARAHPRRLGWHRRAVGALVEVVCERFVFDSFSLERLAWCAWRDERHSAAQPKRARFLRALGAGCGELAISAHPSGHISRWWAGRL